MPLWLSGTISYPTIEQRAKEKHMKREVEEERERWYQAQTFLRLKMTAQAFAGVGIWSDKV